MVSEQSPYATQLKKCDTLLISKSSFIGPMVPVLIGDSLIGWAANCDYWELLRMIDYKLVTTNDRP